jgi:hypothetical protein
VCGIHRWLDQCKADLADIRHRDPAQRLGHNLAIDVFGDFITNSANHRVFVKEIGEQHVVEDLGFIPSLNECLAGLKLEAWMGGLRSSTSSRHASAAPESESC